MNTLPGVLIILLITVCTGLPQQAAEYDYNYENPTDGYEEELVEETAETVKEDIPMLLGQSTKITIAEKEDLEIQCKTAKPTNDILIFKKLSEDEKPQSTLIFVGTMKLARDSRFDNKKDTFRLPSIRRTEAGVYVCHYQTNPDNEIKFEVDVQYAPSVRARSRPEQRVEKGSSVTVECQARGNPEPIISWSKESGRLPSGNEEEEGYSMTLENVDRHVEGTYTCTANNGIGEPVSASMKLVVEYPPEITTEKAIVRTGEGDKVELVCIIHARPGAEVTWSKDGSPLEPTDEITETDGGHRHALTISQVTEEQFGSYRCDAANEKGDSFAVINLTDLPKKPHFTSPSTSAEETSYTLAWETESYYPITEYIVKYRQSKANDSTDMPGEWVEVPNEVPEDETVPMEGMMHTMKHTIDDLLPATDYEAAVSVKNKFKWGEEGKFNFSTRKASPTTTTIATSTTTSTPPPLAEENMQYPHEETVSSRKTSGVESFALNAALCITTLVLTLIS